MENSIQHTQTPEAYKYDFDGACAPHQPHYTGNCETFTLGVFQWLPKAGNKGLKRGRVFYRIKGFRGFASQAYETARAFVAKHNEREARDRAALAQIREQVRQS